MRDSRTVQVLAGVVTLSAVVAAYLSSQGGLSPSINPKPHEAAGAVLARQALSLLKTGGKIIAIARDTATFKNPATDIQLASFKKTLDAAHASVGRLQLLQADPLHPAELPVGDFLELTRNAPAGSVLISFVGPPVLNEIQRKQASEPKPAIVAFCSGAAPDLVDLRGLFEQGLLQAAVVSRRNPQFNPQPNNLQGWFDQYFIAITPENLAGLASR
jgi:hypothetical protein